MTRDAQPADDLLRKSFRVGVPGGEDAGVIVYIGGPLDGKQLIAGAEPWFVDCFDPVRDDAGMGLGAYQVVEVGDGIARTIWLEPWDVFLRALDEAERRHGVG